MDNCKIYHKIKLLFEKLVEPNFTMNNYYVDGLINKLSLCYDPESTAENQSELKELLKLSSKKRYFIADLISTYIIIKRIPIEITYLEKSPVLSDSIVEALDQTDNAHSTVKVFLIRVLAIVAQKELHFAKVFSKQSDRLLAGFKMLREPSTNPSMKVAYTEVALAIVKHHSGISWLLEKGVWKEILKVENERVTVFVVRQKYKFMTEFLWKLNDLADLANIDLVLGCLLEPLNKIDFLNVQSMTSEEEEEICKLIEPSMQILLSILSKDKRIQNKTLLISLLIKEFKVSSHLYVAIDRLRSEETVLLLAKLIFLFNLAKVFLSKPMLPGVQYTGDDFLETAAGNFNIIQAFIQRRSATLVLDYSSACNIIWNSICKDKEPNMWKEDNTKVEMKNQMLFVSLVPILLFVTTGIPQVRVCDMTINSYIAKLLNSACEYTAKAAYSFRDLTNELDTLSVILQSVKKLIHLKDHLNDEQANLVFQALFYVLQEYSIDESNVNQEENFEDSEEKNLVMTYVLDIVLSLVKNRNITWNESLEIICLYNVVNNILRRTNLSCKFIVKALNVMILTVKKFLQPNLSLLMESQPGTALHDLGQLIYKKMHDRNWEIRDTALELLHVCTDISFIKFPSFQKQILDNNLINVAAIMAFNDYDSYVQASALKCIGAASRIGSIWDKLVSEFPDIQERLLFILRNNDEGIVRKEACNIFSYLYQNIKLTPAFKQTLYEHMVSSALTDCHWEVQVSALKFWRIVYKSLLSNQGMLDGEFPPVTFSRESRKIVTLNETEIRKRLLKMLDELASIGCLAVFVKLLQEDEEVAIMDVTLSTAQELCDILNRYKIEDCLKPNADDPSDIEEILFYVKEELDDEQNENMSEVQNQESVIEDILNADDMNLLVNIYDQHMTLQTNKVEVPLRPKIKLTRVVSPYVFVNYLKNTDIKAKIEEKRKWNEGIRSLSSLLDDVLGIYEVNEEVNSLDCY